MRRESLPIDTLPAWARLNGVVCDGVVFQRLRSEDGTDKGGAIVSTVERDTTTNSSTQSAQDDGTSSPQILIRLPGDLILSRESVANYAKSDRHLREVLDAVGSFGTTARGAILIFLLLQLTYSSPDFANDPHRIGVSNPWTEYVKLLPDTFPLPTFYTDEERELLRGTSLKYAVDAKLASLNREFEHLRQSTEHIAWCNRCWWDEQTGKLALNDWKYVDAAYRSRMVDLPGHGHSMVPCIDMANHAAEDTVKALYETDADGNAILEMRWGKKLHVNDEVTISYGEDKSAAEMVFSYGFLENDRPSAREMVLPIMIPDDDPLKPGKQAFFRGPPSIRLFSTSPNTTTTTTRTATDWESSVVWWTCVGIEDGLDFDVLQTTDGQHELRAVWKGEELTQPDRLRDILEADPRWDIFYLRAVVVVLGRFEAQLAEVQRIDEILVEMSHDEDMLDSVFRPEAFAVISRLRRLEGGLLKQGIEDLTAKRDQLMASEIVMKYLQQQQQQQQGEKEDFS